MIHECPTHGSIPGAEVCPICDVEPTVRSLCRWVLSDWVAAWPDPQGWKHEALWQEDGVTVLSQHASTANIWQIAHHIPRWELDDGPPDRIKRAALRAWSDLQKTIEQQDT